MEERIDLQTQTSQVDNTASYRSIFKATSLFGGVQAFQILITVVKSKIIAVLLGPAGVGIQGLYQSVTQLAQGITSLGLSQSAVRDVSEANGTNDGYKINRTISVLQKLVWFTGLLGTISVAVLSPILSKVTFGNYDYIIPIIFLSITLLLDQLCAGQKVILQGLRRLKELAKASAYGSTVGLIVSVPLYYLLGVKGIVPTLILNSVTSLLLSWLYSRKIKREIIVVTPKEVIHDGRMMLRMGLAMSVSNVALVVSAFILRSYIRSVSGVEMVGLFTAGYAIINTYVGMVFTAMSTDFYPRLAAVNNDNIKCREIVNQQGEIGALIMGPMLVICIVFMPMIIKVLYSEDFLEANKFIMIASVGMMFRFMSVLVAHLFLAKGTSKLYMLNELTACIYTLVLNLIGFKLYGLTGLGISFLISYLLYAFQVLLLTKTFFNFRLKKSFIGAYGKQLFILVVVFIVFLIIKDWTRYVIGLSGIVFSLLLSLIGLENRLMLRKTIKSKFRYNNGIK